MTIISNKTKINSFSKCHSGLGENLTRLATLLLEWIFVSASTNNLLHLVNKYSIYKIDSFEDNSYHVLQLVQYRQL